MILPGMGLSSEYLPDLAQVLFEQRKRLLTRNHLEFSRLMFRAKEQMDLIEAPFHQLICDTLQRTMLPPGDPDIITRLIINMPPGFGKTELAVINYIARGFALNPKSRYIHASYGLPLALLNSSQIKETLALDEYREYWEVDLMADTQAKNLWRTVEGGGLRATSAGSPISGFRAGYMDFTQFTGAMVIDDPLKPDDALSKTEREKVNARYMNTMHSRKAHEDVPVIVIMQRLHVEDYAANLLNGASGEKWHHLCLPVEITGDKPTEDFSHAIPIEYDLPYGPLWTEKFNKEAIKGLQSDEYTSKSQYYQRPIPLGGAIFKEHMFEEYEELPNMSFRFIVADTALTEKTSSDFSVFSVFGWGKDKRLYLLDLFRKRMEVPAMEKAALSFWQKHKAVDDPIQMGTLRDFSVENKASGIGLIQRMRKSRMPVKSIERIRSKLERAYDCVPELEVSPLLIPKAAPWKYEFLTEMLQFTGSGSGHDDQVDTVMDAVERVMIKGLSVADVL